MTYDDLIDINPNTNKTQINVTEYIGKIILRT